MRSGRGRKVVIWRKQLRRAQLLGFMRKMTLCLIGLEACGAAHYWARQLISFGHQVHLVSPALVTPYRKGNKTDRNDAEAILEAVTRQSMGFVAIKSLAQQDLLALLRVRSQLLKSRTALCNQLRELLRERGVAVRAGVKRALPTIVAEENVEICGEVRALFSEMGEWLRTLELRIASCDEKLARQFKTDERCKRLAPERRYNFDASIN